MLIPIAFLIVGLCLIAVEVYLIPGFNIIGVLGFLVILFGVGFAFYDTGFTGGLVMLLGSIGMGAGLFYLAWQSGAWERFVLAANLRADDSLAVRESEHRARYLGRTGVALTPLRPTGVAEIGGERIEVATEGDFIASGSRIRVVAMDRRRYFVRLADTVASEKAS